MTRRSPDTAREGAVRVSAMISPLALLLFFAAPGLAEPEDETDLIDPAGFDGHYVPRYLYDAGETASFCPREGLAPYDIADGQFLLENETCVLSEPTEVRDMEAMLFEALCDGLPEPEPERIFVARQFDGVLVVRGGSHFDLVSCPAGG